MQAILGNLLIALKHKCKKIYILNQWWIEAELGKALILALS